MCPRRSESCYEWPLQTWVEGFAGVFRNNDNELTYSQFWEHVIRHMSRVSEDIRQRWYEKGLFDLGISFVWVCSFVDRIINDINNNDDGVGASTLKEWGMKYFDWIITKYPFVCPHCGDKPCTCPSYRDIIELRRDSTQEEYRDLRERAVVKIDTARKEVREKYDEYSGFSINEFMSHFMKIYQGPIYGMSVDEICYHLLEEVGEVSEAIWGIEATIGPHNVDGFNGLSHEIIQAQWDTDKIKNLSQEINEYITKLDKEGKNIVIEMYNLYLNNLISELCDVFSWITSLSYKIQLRRSNDENFVDVWTGKIYSHVNYYNAQRKNLRCPYCNQPICSKECIQYSIVQRTMSGL